MKNDTNQKLIMWLSYKSALFFLRYDDQLTNISTWQRSTHPPIHTYITFFCYNNQIYLHIQIQIYKDIYKQYKLQYNGRRINYFLISFLFLPQGKQISSLQRFLGYCYHLASLLLLLQILTVFILFTAIQLQLVINFLLEDW